MATKPKAILSTHDGREASPITKASNVLFENGQTAQDILNDRQDAMISPVIENSSSMFKVGQGDNVDYSANVVNGAYESMVLKGNTKVNLIQESSSQDVVLPYEFTEGQYVTISDTKETGALGVELKGQTLVNLASLKSNTQISTTLDKAKVLHDFDFKDHMFIAGNGYTIQVTLKINSITNTALYFEVFARNTDGVAKTISQIMESSITSGTTTIQTYRESVLPSVDTGKYPPTFYLAGKPKDSSSPASCDIEVLSVNFLEGDYTNVDIPYFEGMQSVEAPSVTTVGKNLFDKELFKRNASKIPTYRINESVATWQNSGVSESYTLIDGVFKENTQYTFSLKTGLSNNVSLYIYYADNTKKWFNGNIVSAAGKTIRKITPVHSDGSYTTLDINDFQIEETSTPTTYEPYKSTTLTTPEEITLRGIGNVKDTLNTVTGEYTQRIGEIVLDGSENWYCTTDTDTTQRFYFNSSKINLLSDTNSLLILSDKLPTVNEIGVVGIIKWWNGTTSNINIRHTSQTTDEFKKWLSQNPITVHYPLATPITSTVSLTITDQDNAPTTKLSTYNTTTHINASSKEGSLIPTLSHVNPSYPVILKPSTKYSIVANSYSNSHTNSAINFNLGGATASTTVGNRVSTVTTPSTLTSEKLVMSGRGNKLNNVMVIEGDVVGDEPYFEGMCDCKYSQVVDNLMAGHELVSTSTIVTTYEDGIYTYQSQPEYTGVIAPANILTLITSEKLQLNETYTLVFNCSDPDNSLIFGVATLNESAVGLEHTREVTTAPRGVHKMAFKITQDYTTLVLRLFQCKTTTKKLQFKDVMILKGDFTCVDYNIPYCEGQQVIYKPLMTTTGKNLFTGKILNDTSLYFTSGTYYEASDWFATTATYLKRGVYTINDDGESGDGYTYIYKYNELYEFKGVEERINLATNKTFTLNEDSIIKITSRRSGVKTFQIEEGATSTVIESCRSSVVSCNSEVVLRSLPNGVCDTLDLNTGEYVQRIGEVVLDGSEDEGWLDRRGDTSSSIVSTFSMIDHFIYSFGKTSMQCSSFPTLTDINGIKGASNNGWGDKECTWLNRQLQGQSCFIYVNIAKTKLEEDNTDGFRKYLQQNPITVQYELATPITTTIDLQGSPYVYKDGHIQLTGGSIEQSLTPIIEYSVPTNRNGQIRSNQKMVEKHQKELDKLQAIILANLVNSQYNQTLTTLNYELSRV